jgi:hypothetical protein
MRNTSYLLLCAVIFLASCAAQKIPFKSVANDEAQKMYKHYLDPSSGADHSFKEVPKVLGLDTKTLKTFTKKKTEEVKFILAAYLPGTTPAPLNKNTILLQVMKMKDGVKSFTYYDLRQRIDPKTMMIVADPNNTVCPLPPDCVGEIEE